MTLPIAASHDGGTTSGDTSGVCRSSYTHARGSDGGTVRTKYIQTTHKVHGVEADVRARLGAVPARGGEAAVEGPAYPAEPFDAGVLLLEEEDGVEVGAGVGDTLWERGE